MLCDICKKNEAVIHIQEISAAGKKIINICSACAEKHPHANAPLLNFGDILGNIQEITADFLKKKKINSASAVCPKCGWNMQKMEENNGLVGCSECYKTFESVLSTAVNRIHRNDIHTGKRPFADSGKHPDITRQQIRKLEIELNNAVQAEQYEQAAILRDRINALKKNSRKK